MDDEIKEMAQEMINYLNEMGQYTQFIDWMEERGHDRNDVESTITKIEDDL